MRNRRWAHMKKRNIDDQLKKKRYMATDVVPAAFAHDDAGGLGIRDPCVIANQFAVFPVAQADPVTMATRVGMKINCKDIKFHFVFKNNINATAANYAAWANEGKLRVIIAYFNSHCTGTDFDMEEKAFGLDKRHEGYDHVVYDHIFNMARPSRYTSLWTNVAAANGYEIQEGQFIFNKRFNLKGWRQEYSGSAISDNLGGYFKMILVANAGVQTFGMDRANSYADIRWYG